MASATAPPRIELNLEGMTSAYELQDSIMRTHDLGYSNNNGAAVESRQDWTEKCAATLKAGEDNQLRDGVYGSTACKFPEARGYDHQDQDVDVTTRVFLVDEEGVAVNRAVKGEADVDFSKRSTYLFKYDATDSAGNHAEQVVFALILDDTAAPEFEDTCARALTVEAASDWSLCELKAGDNVNNNIDGTWQQDVTTRIRYKIDFLETTVTNDVVTMLGEADHYSTIAQDYDAARQFFHPHGYQSEAIYSCTDGNYDYNTADWTADTPTANCGPTKLGKFLVTATVNDDAGIYGHNAVNNVATTHIAIVVADSRPPVIQLEGHSPVYHECVKDTMFSTTEQKDTYGYKDAGAKALDMLDTWARKQTDQDYQAGCIDCYRAIDGDLPTPAKCGGTATYCKDCGDDCDQSWVYNYDHDKHDGARMNNRMSNNSAGNSGTILFDHTFFNRLDQSAEWTGTTWSNLDNQYKNRTIQFDAEDDRCLSSNTNDCESNNAVLALRTIITQDTIAPTLTLNQVAPEVTTYENAPSHIIYQNNGSIAHYNVSRGHEDNQNDAAADDAAEALGIDPLNSVSVEDMCDDTLNITRSWGPRAYNSRQLGHYVRTYTVTDRRQNVASITRTFNVIDQEAPTIDIVGKATRLFNATRDEEYTDAGATCNDYVDGELSHAVEVSGEVVNMRIPGTYTIRYDCTDLSGNAATPVHRTVEIVDITCPDITLVASDLMYVEAGFPYVDAGATATDTLDGDITQYIWTNGNTVNHQQAFYNQPNCAEIRKQCLLDVTSREIRNRGVLKVADRDAGEGDCRNNGEYYITTIRDEKTIHGISSRKRYHRQLVHCWMTAESEPVTFKIFQLDDCFAVWSELYGGFPEKMECHKQDMCPMIGMIKDNTPTTELIDYIQSIDVLPTGSPLQNYKDLWSATANAAHTIANKNGNPNANITTNGNWFGDSTYICRDDPSKGRVNFRGQWIDSVQDRNNTQGDNVPKITNAEGGKYVIQFHVSDKAGNTECATKFRTVIVKDTLPPIITLALKESSSYKDRGQYRLIHYSDDSSRGINGQKNPAGINDGDSFNPYLKAKNSNLQIVNSSGFIDAAVEPYTGAAPVSTETYYAGDSRHYEQYMAEAAAPNAWIIGAVASAVAGVALLSYSSRKSTVSVPV
jgi:hypothetical protein